MLQRSKSSKTTVDVELHDLEDARTHKHEISGVLNLLEHPLPVERLREAKLLTTYPPDFRAQIDTLCDRYSNHEEHNQPSRFLEVRPVTDILETVLNSVLFLRYSKSCVHGFKERRSSWISMLAACGMAMAEDVAICEDARISTPRAKSNQHVLNSRDFETEAALTLSVTNPRTPRHHARKPVIVSDEEHDSSSTSDASYDSYATLDFPFDAHVTPPRGKRVDFVLPVVFAARRQEIQDIMTSLVCQRRLLDITTPVIGIVLHEEGTCASLAFGWFDNTNSPTIHLAYAAASDSPASHPLPQGIFDGANPISALRLAQFILDLESHFASIKRHLHQPQVHDFCWRLDHAHFDHSHISSLESNDVPCSDEWARVREWVATLDLADTPEPVPPFLELLEIGEAILVAETITTVPRTASSESLDTVSTMSKKTSGSKPSHTTGNTSINTTLEVPKPASQMNSGKSMAASDYAKVVTEDDDRGLGIWTRGHGTMQIIALPSEQAADELQRQMHEMQSGLFDVIKPGWPENWKTLDDLPHCDPILDEYRNTLFESYKKSKVFNDKEQCDLLPADHTTCVLLESCMSLLLNVAANASATNAICADGILSEAATRSAWDQLLRLGCRAPGEAASRSFFVEKMIRLPAERNKTAAFDFHLFASTMAIIASQQVTAALQLKQTLPSAIPGLAQHASQQAINYCDVLEKNGCDAVAAADRALQPSQARMDGVYCLPYDLATVVKPPPPTPPAAADPLLRRSARTATPQTPEEARPTLKLPKGLQKIMTNFRSFFTTKSSTSPTDPCKEASRERARGTPVNGKSTPKSQMPATTSEQPTSQPSALCAEPPSLPDGATATEGSTSKKPRVLKLKLFPKVPHSACSMCPDVTSTVHEHKKKKESPTSDTTIFVPFIFAEYKRDAKDSYQAFNQVKLYCISGVEFLASIGIKDFPVWGIVTAGSEGVILMAWKSTALPAARGPKTITTSPEYNFLFDRNLKRFNLTDPLQVLHFFVCVRRIYAYQDELKSRLDKLDMEQYLGSDTFEDWMMPKPKS